MLIIKKLKVIIKFKYKSKDNQILLYYFKVKLNNFKSLKLNKKIKTYLA